MQAQLVVAILLGLTGCVAGVASAPPDGTVPEGQPTLPAGYPAKIGDMASDLHGQTQAWETYDYSVGTLDAAVQVERFNGETRFSMMAELPGHPERNAPAVFIRGGMPGAARAGTLTTPVVEIVTDHKFAGARLSSIGSETTVVLDSLTPVGPDGGYGHVTGHFGTMLCAAVAEPARINRKACQTFTGTFSTDFQISGS